MPVASAPQPGPAVSPAVPIYRHVIHHEPLAERPAIAFGKAAAIWSPRKVEICKRLIRAYQAGAAQGDESLKAITDADLWTGITSRHFAELLAFVEAGDAVSMSHYLDTFGSDYVWFGDVTTGLDGYNHWDLSESAIAYTYFDKLLSLAEAFGVMPVENPEQGPGGNWGRNALLDPAAVFNAVSRHVGIDVLPPVGTIPVAGIKVPGGLLHYRHINSLYVAQRIRNLTQAGDAVCEYGGGLGLVAFYLYRMGRRDTTIFDIPTTNLLSGYFLLNALGEDAVTLEGEAEREGTICIRANWNCCHIPDDRFRLAVNVDSFPEINRRIFDAYVVEIQRTTTEYFLSINHEVEHAITGGARHLNVGKLLAGEPDWQRLSRSPYWLRRGYVEELYRLPRANSRAGAPQPLALASPPRPSLHELYQAHGDKVSDKWSLYLNEYDRLFSPYREQPVRLLEIGIQNGGSLEIWSKFFPNARRLLGCDINPRCARLQYDDARIDVIVGDATLDATRELILAQSARWDLVIDDGSHTSRDIVRSFLTYFPHVEPGGLFVAEDLHCSYWEQWQGGLFHPFASVTFFKLLADVVNHEHWGLPRERKALVKGFMEQYGGDIADDDLAQIHSVEFINSICVVRKAPATRNLLGTRIIAGTDESVLPGILGTQGKPALHYEQKANPWAARERPSGEELLQILTALVQARQAQPRPVVDPASPAV